MSWLHFEMSLFFDEILSIRTVDGFILLLIRTVDGFIFVVSRTDGGFIYKNRLKIWLFSIGRT